MSWLRVMRNPEPLPPDQCRMRFESAACRARDAAPPGREYWLAEIDRMLDHHAGHADP